MTSHEFREALARLGMSQERLSRLMGIRSRTIRRWVHGDYPIPPLAARYLRLVQRVGIEEAERLAGNHHT